MRPRELTLQGFRSYRERSTFDFRDRHLIGVVGPIGSGKSSLLDAIAFALYGKTPTFERDTRSLIHQLCDVAHVEFVFEVDGQIWRVQRGLRKKGQSGHKLERLSEDAPGADVLESVQLDKPVRERVEQLLGMGFDAFRRSVLLAQNRFAEFLRASDGQRNDVLKGVFGYERFDDAQTAAKDRARDAEGELALLELEGGRLRQAEEERGEATEKAEAAAARHALLDAASSRVAAHDEARTAAQGAVAEAGQRIEALRGLAATLPPADELAAVIRVAEEGGVELERLQAREADAAAAAGAAEAEHAEIAERVGDRASFTAFAELVARLGHQAEESARAAAEAERAAAKADELTADAGKASAAAEAADELVATAEAALTEAADRAAQADAALHEARHAEMARELRRHLQAGEPCPVCAQVIVEPPRAAPAAKVATAEKTLARARRAKAEARAATELAGQRAAIAAERAAAALSAAEQAGRAVDEAAYRARAADAALAVTRSELVDRLGDGDPRMLLQAREAELEAAESHLRDAAKQLTEARAELDEARRTGLEATRALAALATKAATAWGALGEPHDIATDAAGVRLAYLELGDALIA
ncbi:MAG: AAA family ATPase, partial [Actinomycetota bacterium]